MRLRKMMYIFVLAVFVLTACGNETEEKKEPTKTEQTDKQEDSTDSSEAKDEDSQSTPDAPNDDEVQEPSNQAESNTNQSNKNESTGNSNTTTGNTTTKPSSGNTDSNKKPSTGSNTKPSTDSTGSTNSGSTGNTQNNNGGTQKPSTLVHTHTWVEITKTVDVAEVGHHEDVYDWRTLCGKCDVDMTDFTDDELTLHSAIICRSGYSTHYIKVGEKWVIDTPAGTKTEIVGYKCECGAEKK